MLSCLSHCCPALFRSTSNRSEQSPLLQKPQPNYAAILKELTPEDILKFHQTTLKNSEFRENNPDAIKTFYTAIPGKLCSHDFGKTLIDQIFNSSNQIENNFKLALMCIKHIPANTDIKRELQIKTRDIMCKAFLINQNTSLKLLTPYYDSINLTNYAVIENERAAIPTLGTHKEWTTEVTKALESALKKQTPFQDTLRFNIEQDTIKRDQILNGKK